MGDMLLTLYFYLLALIGVISVMFIILAVYICWRYDIKIHIGSKEAMKDAGTSDTQKADHSPES